MIILRDVLRVAGPDAASFLQGQVSQDIEALAVGSSAWALVLQPQGKIDAWVRVTRQGDDTFVLDVDHGFGDGVAARLERFKLRVDATVDVVGPRPCEVGQVADETVPLAVFSHVDLAGDPGGADPGWETAWDALRVRLGIPAMGRELTEDTIPEEAGLVDASVSFTKGCYTGQELVARIDSRGRNVPRRIRRVVADAPLSAGAELSVAGKAVGTITSATGTIGLALVARAVEPPATVDIAGVGVARIEALTPLR